MLGPDITNRQRRPGDAADRPRVQRTRQQRLRHSQRQELQPQAWRRRRDSGRHRPLVHEDRRPHRLPDGANRSRQGHADQGRGRIEGVSVEAGAARQLKGPWCLGLGPWSVPGPRTFVFRFCVVYFTLYALATQIIGGVILTPWFSFPALGNVWPMRDDHRVAGRARLRPSPAARLHRQQRRHRISLDSERLAAGAGRRSSPPPG